jgi:hypothetical protein
MQRRQWIAFALRYLEPLATGGTETNTRAAVLDELNHTSKEKLATLLFGTYEVTETILKTFFHKSADQTEITLPDWQQQAITDLRCPDYSEDVIKTWSRALLDPLLSAAVQQLRPTLNLVAEESAHLFGKQNNTPSSQFSAIFEQHLATASETANRVHYGQALGYRNEYKRRLEIITIYSRASALSTLIAVPIMVIFAFLGRGQPNGWLLPSGVALGVILVFYGRLGNYLLDTFTWARASQDTLETLLGSQPQ